MTITYATAMDALYVVPRVAPTGLSSQGRGASAGSLGGTRLRTRRGFAARSAIALERDSRPGAVTV